MHILVVDDHVPNRELLRAQLAGEGHRVTDVEDGVLALDILNREPIDAVISDILMPRMDGYRLCFEVRRHARFRTLPFVFYTATYTSPSDEKLATDVGADAYLRKPASAETISRVLSAAVRSADGARHEAPFSEADVLKEYSEQLVSKLEEKNIELLAQTEALRDSESHLQAIIATEPECVKLLRADGALLEMNPAGLRMLEADSFQQVANHCVYALVVEEYREAFRALTDKVFAGASGTLEFQIIGLKGGRRWLETHAGPLRDAAGNVTALLGITRDVTERRRIEEHFRQAHKLEAIGRLAGGVAHDFNNILSAILGNVDLARANLGSSDTVAESLDAISKAGNRAKDLVRQILAFSRRQPQARCLVAVGPVVEEAVSLLRATLPSVVELVKNIAADVPNILADATQIHQVIFNLCTNAWHALDGEPGRIEIGLETVTVDDNTPDRPVALRSGRFARLSVRDTGKGMSAETLEHIFEPFFTTKAPGQGTGLGLSVVHGIVQDHDGAISVTSETGRGTTFHLYFPAAEGSVDAPAPTIVAPRRGRGQRILYLDDEEALVDLARRMLEPLGYNIAGFTRPAEALEKFRGSPGQFDVVVTDMNMPGATGLNVASEIRKIRADMIVVLISGNVTEDLQEQAQRAGIRQVLYKPTSMEEFAAALDRLIGTAESSPSA